MYIQVYIQHTYVQSYLLVRYNARSMLGSFVLISRGKPHGHDLDLLLSHPERHITEILLERLLACLYKKVKNCMI